jgi:PRC-barrel domain
VEARVRREPDSPARIKNKLGARDCIPRERYSNASCVVGLQKSPETDEAQAETDEAQRAFCSVIERAQEANHMQTDTTQQATLEGHDQIAGARTSHNLIASDRVEGTPVRRAKGGKIGTVQRLMIDKVSGNVAYAVLTFGGFLGFGQKHFPIPWARLKYDLGLEAYIVDLTDEELSRAPAYEADEEFDWGDRSQEIVIHRYYKTPQYWSI